MVIKNNNVHDEILYASLGEPNLPVGLDLLKLRMATYQGPVLKLTEWQAAQQMRLQSVLSLAGRMTSDPSVPAQVVWVEVERLKPNPLHETIFGREDITTFAEQVKASGRQSLQPIFVNQQNVILGDHRPWLVAPQLGWKTLPVLYVRLDGDEEEKEFFLLANYQRQCTVEQRVRLGLLLEDFLQPLAEKRKRAGIAVGDLTKDKAAALGEKGDLRDQVAKRVDFGCGRSYTTAKTVVQAIDDLAENGNAAAAEGLRRLLNLVSVSKASGFAKALRNHDRGSKDAIDLLTEVGTTETTGDPGRGLLSKAQKKCREDRQAQIPDDLPAFGDRYEVHEGDILVVGKKLRKRLLALPDPCVVTDLPYTSSKDHEGLGENGDTVEDAFEKLCRFHTDFMPDDTCAVVLVGQHHLDKIFHILEGFPKLTYYWTISVLQPGGSPKLRQRNVNTQWKAALVIVKGPYRGERFNDLIKSEPLQKHQVKRHVWEQSEVPFANIITEMTRPGVTIIDPFCGSASVGAAALKLNRRYIGIDINPGAVKTAKDRLAQQMKTDCGPTTTPPPPAKEILDSTAKVISQGVNLLTKRLAKMKDQQGKLLDGDEARYEAAIASLKEAVQSLATEGQDHVETAQKQVLAAAVNLESLNSTSNVSFPKLLRQMASDLGAGVPVAPAAPPPVPVKSVDSTPAIQAAA